MSLRDRLNRSQSAPAPSSEGLASGAQTPAAASAMNGLSWPQPAAAFSSQGSALAINASGAAALPETAQAPAANHRSKGDRFEELKNRVHTLLVDNLKLEPGEEPEAKMVTVVAAQILEHLVNQEQIPMARSERALLVQELCEEVVGLGPLEPLLRDPLISDILVNGPKNVFVEKNGKLVKSTVEFKDNDHLMHIVDRIVSGVGRRVDEKTPMVDARLKDGSRFNAIIPPLALDGPSLSIRKFKQDAGTLQKLLGWGSMTPEMAMTLEAAVKARLNVVVSGSTGAGKTTLLNALSAVIPFDERIITIEDSAELQLQQEHVVRLETRPSNIEGEGAIHARELLINCLRMRPDRIIVGECRGGEALDMLQAMNTGHDGSLTTLHANSPRDALSRIETMCMMNEHPLPEKTIRQQMASAIHLIVQASRLQCGARKVVSISEVVGMEGNTVLLQEIFKFNQTGLSPEGKVLGHHEATGVRPKFCDHLKAHGIELPIETFVPSTMGAANATRGNNFSQEMNALEMNGPGMQHRDAGLDFKMGDFSQRLKRSPHLGAGG